jgi:hypothetical protein
MSDFTDSNDDEGKPLTDEERSKLISEGVRLGHEGADRAADAAGELWKAEALEAFIRHARSHQSFTTEDVRLANPDLRCNADLRAWGHIATRAKKDGVVKHAGYARSISANVHSSVNTLWGSLIFEGA